MNDFKLAESAVERGYDLEKAKLMDGIKMTHDQLVVALGEEAFNLINNAGFVLVPRQWRERVFNKLSEGSK